MVIVTQSLLLAFLFNIYIHGQLWLQPQPQSLSNISDYTHDNSYDYAHNFCKQGRHPRISTQPDSRAVIPIRQQDRPPAPATPPRHQKRRLSLPGAVVLHSHSQTSLVFFIARTLNLRHRATHPRRKKEHKNRILCVSKRISFGPMLLLDKNVTLIPLSFR